MPHVIPHWSLLRVMLSDTGKHLTHLHLTRLEIQVLTLRQNARIPDKGLKIPLQKANFLHYQLSW